MSGILIDTLIVVSIADFQDRGWSQSLTGLFTFAHCGYSTGLMLRLSIKDSDVHF